MNPSETVIKLEQSIFNSDETEILATAFEKAWAFVEFDPKLEALEESKRRSELARYLMKLLKLGEMNPTSLANSAIRVRLACAAHRILSRGFYGFPEAPNADIMQRSNPFGANHQSWIPGTARYGAQK